MMHRVSSTGNAASTSRPRKEKRVTFVVGNSRSAKHCSGINAVVVDRATLAEGGQERDVLFTGSRDGTVKRWELEESSAECGATFESHVDWVNDITWVGQDKLVSCSSDTTLKVWGAFSQGECLKTLRQHTDYVTCVSAARETNTVVSAGLSCEVFIWDIEAALSPVTRAPPPQDGPHEGTASPPPVRGVDPMAVYRATSIGGVPVGSGLSMGHTGHGGGHGLANGTGGGGRAGTPPDVGRLGYLPLAARGHKESVYALAVNDAGTVIVSGGTEKAIRVWDPRTGTKTMKLKGHTDNIRALILDPTGRYCLSGSSDSIIRLWDLGMQRCMRSYAVHTDSVWALAASIDFQSVYSGGRDKGVYKTDLRSSETSLLCQEQHPVLSLALQEEEGIWVATTDSSLRKWSALDDSSSLAHGSSSFHAGSLPFVRASLEGAVAAAPLHSKPLVTILGNAGIVQHSILNDKRHVLTKDADGVVKLWELTRGQVVEDYGKVPFEEKDKDLFEQVSVPSWFSMDTRLGSISVHLETPQCFAAEMYATDLDVPGASEELKLNLGQHTLRGLFAHWAERWKRRVESQASARCESTPSMDLDRDASAASSGRPSGADEAAAGEGADVLAGVLPAFEFSTERPPSILTEGQDGAPWRKAATDLDGTEDEKDLPLWCIECVLNNRLPQREPAKCSFHLHPYEGSGLRTLTSGKLSAPRILRIQKVMNYVQERLTQERPAESEYNEGEPSPATSPQPSGNGNGQSVPPWNSRQMLFEILCNDQVLPQEMSLASVRTYVWKRPEDLVLSYRYAQGSPLPQSNHQH